MADEPQTDPNKSNEPSGGTEPPNSDPKKSLEEQIAELTADRDRWKGLSRTNEDRWKSASQERDELKQAQMSDSEKALEQARNEGRSTAAKEFGTDLAKAAMATAAAKAQVELPDLDYLNMDRFLGDGGRPNEDAISAFVGSLPKPSQQPKFTQNVGLGRQGDGSGNSQQLTREEYNRLSREDRHKARSEGRVNSLLRGELN